MLCLLFTLFINVGGSFPVHFCHDFSHTNSKNKRLHYNCICNDLDVNQKRIYRIYNITHTSTDLCVAHSLKLLLVISKYIVKY